MIFSVIRRLIDCCNESPTMPDFCLSWFKLFRIFSSLFPLGFILKHIQPLIIYEIGLFNNQTNFNTLLLPCYTGALIGPLVAISTECQQHFSLALREVRYVLRHLCYVIDSFHQTFSSHNAFRHLFISGRVREAYLN